MASGLLNLIEEKNHLVRNNALRERSPRSPESPQHQDSVIAVSRQKLLRRISLANFPSEPGFLFFSVTVSLRLYTMTTHTEGRDAFVHMFDNVFEIGVNYPLALALEKCGYRDIHDIIGMSPADIKALSYEDDQGIEIDLPILHRLPITFLRTRFNFDTWKSITTQDFICYAELCGFNNDDFSWKCTEASFVNYAEC